MKSILWLVAFVLAGTVLIAGVFLAVHPSLSSHQIIIQNGGNSNVEYKLFTDLQEVGNGTLLPHTSAVITLTQRGNPDTTLTVLSEGRSYQQIYGGGGFGGPPAMPDKVYFVIGGP